MLEVDPIFRHDLGDKDKVVHWIEAIIQKIESKAPSNGTVVHYKLNQDPSESSFLPMFILHEHGIPNQYPLKKEFFSGNDYLAISNYVTTLSKILQPGAYVQRNEQKHPITDVQQAIKWLLNEAKKGFSIQRYNGLGEMNPEQLWETTMDPTTRRMIKVKIEDIVTTDQIFTTLMGDQVEPRRQFIEENALDATNIDI
jgi:DNA gyrase subunit B